jgi:hypothetical protein
MNTTTHSRCSYCHSCGFMHADSILCTEAMNSHQKTKIAIGVGQRWEDQYGAVRIMALVEGYIVMRRHGCAPFILDEKKFRSEFRPAPK